MGTRADFYVGTGKDAEWLGSVAWDGYEWDNEDNLISRASSPDAFRVAVNAALAQRKDATFPKDGWPWPWGDSNTTDYAYVFNEGKTTIYCFGREVFVNEEGERDTHEDKAADFPDMKSKQNVTYGKRSGVLIISG